MPIYEYRCEDCGEELEKLQKISDSPLVDCPDCGEPSLRKLMSAAGFRLKGGGWYETDFKTGDRKKNLAGDGKSKTEGKKDGGKAEAKSSGAGSKPSKSESKSTGSSKAASTA